MAVAAAVVTAVTVAGAATAAAPTAAARHLADPRPPGASPVIQRLSNTQLAGQRVIYSNPGLTPPPALLRAIRRGQAAGVIFFTGNIASAAQLAAVSRQLQRADASRRNPLRAPLLLMTDQEGGVVRRLPGAPEPAERQISQAADPAAQARRAGAGAAANLRGSGLHVEPGRPCAAARSQDTDLRPVTLPVSTATLRRVDERPYRAAITARVKLVMVSWAVYLALDPGRPAGFSPRVVQGELRQRLGFGGVTITDALEAGALRRYATIARRSQLAALAGMDLLLCSGHSVGEGQRAVAGLARGYGNGTVSRDSGEAAVARITALRGSLY